MSSLKNLLTELKKHTKGNGKVSNNLCLPLMKRIENHPDITPTIRHKVQDMFTKGNGYVIVEVDLSQAELRIAADMANDRTMLEIYRTGGDIHRATACIVLGITMEDFLILPKEDQKSARFKAKACIAHGQLVLTDKGLVPIQDITIDHLVWDGIEWVKHEGLIYQGYKEVIEHGSLTATKDHEVYTTKGRRVPFGDIASKICNEPMSTGSIGENAIRYSTTYRYSEARWKVEKVRRGLMQFMQQEEVYTSGQHKSREDNQLCMPKICKTQWYSSLQKGKHKCSDLIRKVRCYCTKVYKPKVQGIQELWYERNKMYLQIKNTLHRILPIGVSLQNLCWAGDRQDKEQWRLCYREHKICSEKCKPTKQEKFTETRFPRERDKHYRSTRRDTKDRVNLQIQQRVDSEIIQGKRYECRKDNKVRYAHVYDLKNAGPRHRFTVSGVVVSNCNFGFLYGMGWRNFIIYAKTQYGVEFTDIEAKRVRNGFFSEYSSLAGWHEAMINYAKQHGHVRSYSGRIRHLPMINSDDDGVAHEAGRQAINSPVQNFGSDLGIMAMSAIAKDIDEEYIAIVGFVHDAIYAYVPEEYVEWGAKTIKRYMENIPLEDWFGRKMKLPIVADVGFGWNAGETYEMEGLELEEDYDFEELAWNEEEDKYDFELPEQEIPPNAGVKEQPEHMDIYV